MKKKTEELKSVSFRFPASLVERLEKAKWDLRMSKAEVVKTALEELFKKHGIK